MKKNILIVLLYTVIGFLGLAWIVYNIERQAEERKNAPVLSYRTSIDINVNSISFERNGLYINDTLFNTGGISGYSRIHNNKEVKRLRDIEPPFRMAKGTDNDTLQISRDNKQFYLLISEEVRCANENE